MADVSRPLHFLVVDDDITLSVYLKNILQADGHRVSLAVNEHGALETLNQGPVDILLCDFMLPGLDGMQIIDIAKKRPEPPFCVLITGVAGPLRPKQPVDVPADLFITKPILKDTLAGIIQHFHRQSAV